MKNAAVYFDTNVLLDLYSYSEDTIKSIIDAFSLIEKYADLIIPRRAYEEFLRHYRSCRSIKFGRNNLAVYSQKFDDCYRQIILKLDNLPKIYDQYDCKIENLFKKEKQSIEIFADRVKQEIDSLSKNVSPVFDDAYDPIFEFVEKYKPNPLITLKEKIDVSIWGEQRIKLGLKPGQKDYKEKEQFDKFGDIYIWKEILDSSPSLIMCYFITNETKDDWWKAKDSSEFDSQLIEEYKELHPNTNFIALRFPDFCSIESSSFDNKALTEINALMTKMESLLNDKEGIVKIIADNIWGYNLDNIEKSLLMETVRGGNIERVDDFEAVEIIESESKVISIQENNYEETADIECEIPIVGIARASIRYFGDAYDYLTIKFKIITRISALLSFNYFPSLSFKFEDIFDISAVRSIILEDKDCVPDPDDYR